MNKIDIIEIENDNELDIFEETYNIINKKISLVEDYNKKVTDNKLLKVKIEQLEEEIDYLNKKYEKNLINNEELLTEISGLKKELLNQKKRSLMLKALIKIMIKNYGIENISKVTNLSLEQIKKYLN